MTYIATTALVLSYPTVFYKHVTPTALLFFQWSEGLTNQINGRNDSDEKIGSMNLFSCFFVPFRSQKTRTVFTIRPTANISHLTVFVMLIYMTATSRIYRATLGTKDDRIRDYPHVNSIW